MCITAGGLSSQSPWAACGLGGHCTDENSYNNGESPDMNLEQACPNCTPIKREDAGLEWCQTNCCYFNWEENNMSYTDCFKL